jgi:SAM-dependent methyltransferase
MDPKKFDPARAHLLDSPERDRMLPTGVLLELLDLRGGETVVDYGAGTGRLTAPIAERLSAGGRVIAVDENAEMAAHLEQRLAGVAAAQAVLIEGNSVPLPDGAADRILAVNLLHEIRGEGALAEMRRLLRPGGFALVVDWERGRPRDTGPPDELLYTAAEAVAELGRSGLRADLLDAPFPFHFALRAV